MKLAIVVLVVLLALAALWGIIDAIYDGQRFWDGDE